MKLELHNKSFKFVPALRASTGRKNVAHFCPYVIRTSLFIIALAAILTVLIQITLFETVILSTPLSSDQIVAMNTMTVEEWSRHARKNPMVSTGLDNLKNYLSSPEALLVVTKDRVLPIFFAVLISLFAANYWHVRRATKQIEDV